MEGRTERCNTIEEVLRTYFGLRKGAKPDGSDWVSAYERMVRCIEEIGSIVGVGVEEIVKELDYIDSSD